MTVDVHRIAVDALESTVSVHVLTVVAHVSTVSVHEMTVLEHSYLFPVDKPVPTC